MEVVGELEPTVGLEPNPARRRAAPPAGAVAPPRKPSPGPARRAGTGRGLTAAGVGAAPPPLAPTTGAVALSGAGALHSDDPPGQAPAVTVAAGGRGNRHFGRPRFAYKTCPELLREELERDSIHRLLIQKDPLPLTRAPFTMAAHVAAAREARPLHGAPGTPGFRVEPVTLTVGHRPVTLMTSLYRGDECRLTADLGPIARPFSDGGIG